jgi:hypothetical protein
MLTRSCLCSYFRRLRSTSRAGSVASGMDPHRCAHISVSKQVPRDVRANAVPQPCRADARCVPCGSATCRHQALLQSAAARLRRWTVVAVGPRSLLMKSSGSTWVPPIVAWRSWRERCAATQRLSADLGPPCLQPHEPTPCCARNTACPLFSTSATSKCCHVSANATPCNNVARRSSPCCGFRNVWQHAAW